MYGVQTLGDIQPAGGAVASAAPDSSGLVGILVAAAIGLAVGAVASGLYFSSKAKSSSHAAYALGGKHALVPYKRRSRSAAAKESRRSGRAMSRGS